MRSDDFYMARALAVAERGRGRTSPNPMVGAVIVDAEGVVVGSGSHEVAGGPHAEVEALAEAGSLARGATLYCTLEPCSHTGRTPPCAPRVADAGIARAVIAVEDPNPLVSGRGLALLRDRSIAVATGVRRDEARALNRPFFSVMLERRPYVTIKVAVSKDGKISESAGVRTRLTGPAADRFIHRERAEMDALAIGSGTVLSDDPLLTPRGAYRYRPLTRVVFDTRLRTPPSAKLFSTLSAGPVIIMSTPPAAAAAPDRLARLRERGAEVTLVPGDSALPGARRGEMLRSALEQLAGRGICSVTVEGGAMLHQSFWDAALVDRVQIFRTPRCLGATGVDWLPAVASGAGLSGVVTVSLGADTLIEGYVHRVD